MTTEASAENPPSLLRPPRLATVNDEDYAMLYWPKLNDAVLLILQQKPGQFIPISYEEMYSAVYKCVCQQHSEKMYKSLTDLVSSHLQRVTEELQTTSAEQYPEKFNFVMAQFFQGVSGVVAIFNYMNRFYVIPKLHTDLRTQMLNQFTEMVATNPYVFEVIENASSRPFAVSPQTLMSIVKGLYSLKPEFAERSPQLFARFIPNMLPATQPQDLPFLMEQTQQMQEELAASQGFTRQDGGRKRSCEDLQV